MACMKEEGEKEMIYINRDKAFWYKLCTDIDML